MERAVHVSIVEDNDNQKEDKDSAEYHNQTEKGKKNDTMVAYAAPTAIATRKRQHSYDMSSIANSPYYDSNTEDNRALKRLHKSSYQGTTASEASSNSTNREDNRRSQISPGDASHASSYTQQTRPDAYASRRTEHKFFEENLMESMNNRSSAYLPSPRTSFVPPHMRAQNSLLENVYNSGDTLRTSDGAGTLDLLDPLHSEPNGIPISLRNQSILTQNASILENEKRRQYLALQEIERAKASRTRLNLQVGLNRIYAEQNNRPNTIHSFGESQIPTNLYASNANRDDIRGGNQDVDAYFLTNSIGRHGNHVLPSRANHHGLSISGSAAFVPNQLMSANMPETSLANRDHPFIHRLPTSKHSSFSEREMKNDVSLRQGPGSHPSGHHPFPHGRIGPQSSPYDMAILRRQQESVDPDQIERRTAGLPELPRHFRGRLFVPLGTIEDEIWLSPFLCFLRSQCIEMFRAKDVDVSYRRSAKTKVESDQIGIRCRFCAHKPYQGRGKRSSSFPSSVSRIYQSVTMMIREHFHSCSEFPQEVRKRYCALKGETTKGELESKRYWAQSAAKLGMNDTPTGIFSTSLTESGQLP